MNTIASIYQLHKHVLLKRLDIANFILLLTKITYIIKYEHIWETKKKYASWNE